MLTKPDKVKLFTLMGSYPNARRLIQSNRSAVFMPLQAAIFHTHRKIRGSVVFSTVKRHKCRAPARFLNQPCLSA